MIEASKHDFKPTIQTNVLGPHNFIKAFVPLMIESSNKNNVIVNIASPAHKSPNHHKFAPYTLSQFSLEGLTLSAAADLLDIENTSILSVHPGLVLTEMLEECLGKAEAERVGVSIEQWIETFPHFLLDLNKSHSGKQLSWPEDVESVTGEKVKNVKVQQHQTGKLESSEQQRQQQEVSH